MRPNFAFRKIFLLFLFSFLIIHSTLCIATIRYVSKTGSSIPPYITWETAADSIQKCINICVFGDTVYVANGVYEEQVVMIPGLSLIGAGTDSCIVDSRNFPLSNNRTITMQDSCLITGFYIRSSSNFSYGYGIWAVGQTGLITQNKFSDARSGIYLDQSSIKVYKNHFFNIRGGIEVWSSNSIVRKNEIYILTDQAGEGIFIAALNANYSPLVDSNVIMTIGDGIRKSLGSRPRIINNSISLRGGEGIQLSYSDSVYVFNNRIFVKSGGEGIYQSGPTYLQLVNNYFTGNLEDAITNILPNNSVKNNVVTNANRGVVFMGSGNFNFHYNDIWNTNINYTGYTPDSTNLSVDPMIVNDDTTQGDLDFHLQKYSPLIDAGDLNILDKDSTRSDIGLYGGPYGESYVYIDLPPRPPVNFTAEVDSGSSFVVLTWNRNTEADTAYYNVYRDTLINFQIDSLKLISSQTDTILLDQIPSEYKRIVYKITAVDQQGNESLPSEEQVINIVGIDKEPEVVRNYILYQNYPNPFNPSTKIGYKLKERGYVKLYVYDIKGELVSVLVNEVQEAGYYEVGFNVGQESIPVLSSGVYICQIFVQGENNIPVFSDIKKMLLVK